jgi:hypothetical protein
MLWHLLVVLSLSSSSVSYFSSSSFHISCCSRNVLSSFLLLLPLSLLQVYCRGGRRQRAPPLLRLPLSFPLSRLRTLLLLLLLLRCQHLPGAPVAWHADDGRRRRELVPAAVLRREDLPLQALHEVFALCRQQRGAAAAAVALATRSRSAAAA